MRILLLLAMGLFLNKSMHGQPLAGMGAGYTTARSPVLNLQLGFKLKNHLFYFNQLIHLTRNAAVPVILGIRYGYNIGSFQPNGGVDYHKYSSDKYRINKPREGFHFAFGLSKYFRSVPLKIDLGMSDQYIIGCVGLYKIID